MNLFRIVPILALSAFVCVSHPAHGVDDEVESRESEQPKTIVTLIDAGAEPRVPLRFRPPAGQVTHTEMLTRMTMTQQIGDMQAPSMAMPEMRIVMTTTVDDVSDDGSITTTAEFTDTSVDDEPGVNPMMRQEMQNMLRSMRGTTVQSTVTDRGIVLAAEMDLPDTVDPAMRLQMEGLASSLEQFASPVPDEAVGIGAKWTVRSTLTDHGMTIEQTATFTLRSKNGDELELDVEMEQTAPQQNVDNPGLPPGATMELIRLSTEGKGRTRLNLAQVMPIQANVDMISDSEMNFVMNDVTQRMKQRMEMSMRFSAVEADESQ